MGTVSVLWSPLKSPPLFALCSNLGTIIIIWGAGDLMGTVPVIVVPLKSLPRLPYAPI
jgi:hypothetical protein